MPRLALDRAERRPPTQAALVIVRGSELGRRITLEDSPFTLGTGHDCSLVLRGEGIASHHCTLQRRGEAWSLQTAPGAPNVRVRDELVANTALVHRTRIQIGSVALYFLDDSHGTLESEHFALLYDLATIDDLTGVHTPRFMRETLERNLRHAANEQRSVTVILVALAGTLDDAVMIAAARMLRRCMPSSGLLGLTQDRGFAILLPDLTVEAAMELAARMQSEVARALSEPAVHIGGATTPDATASAEDLWTAAEQSLRDASASEDTTVRVTAVPLP